MPTGEVRRIGATNRVGTKTTFKPDPLIFPGVHFQYGLLHRRLQELAFLNRGIKIVFRDDRSGTGETFKYDRGILEFVEHLNRAAEPIHADIIYLSGAVRRRGPGSRHAIHRRIHRERPLLRQQHQHHRGRHPPLRLPLRPDPHAQQLRQDAKTCSRTSCPRGDDFREGLSAVLSLRVPNPQFEGQTKTKLGNSEIEGLVTSAVGDYLGRFLEENPKTARVIVQKALLAAEARESAARPGPWSASARGPSPAAGCRASSATAPAATSSSASSTWSRAIPPAAAPEGGRMREFQAILPLRGKIINAYKARDDKVLANEEIRSMISAIGSGIGEEVDLTKRRYGKIVIMTDADVDGSHIRTLLLTFFYRQMYELVRSGYVYVAQPPLFRVRRKKDTYYVQTEEEMKEQLLELGLTDAEFEPGDGRVIGGRRHGTALPQPGLDGRGPLGPGAPRDQPPRPCRAAAIRRRGRLPVFHVFLGHEEHWFTTRRELDNFVAQREEAAGEELHVSDQPVPGEPAPGTAPTAPSVSPRGCTSSSSTKSARSTATWPSSARWASSSTASCPQDRTGLEEPRYKLRRGESVTGLEDLRGLLAAIRAAGERGLHITRFKGLGEMNAEELRDTTLDPAHRTLLQVRMEDAGAADDMFRILMGDKVEPRREFIEKHALEARNLDV